MHTNSRARCVLALLAFATVFLVAMGLGFAADDAHADPTAPTAIPTNDVIEAVVNFCLFSFLLYYFTRKPLMEFLSQRRLRLAEDIEEAERLRSEAETKLSEYSERLDRIEAERKEILDGYRRQGEAERKAIVEEARAVAERMKADAKTAIEHDLKRAQSELKERIIDEAVNTARKTIRSRMDAGTNARLVDDYTSALRELPQAEAEGGA